MTKEEAFEFLGINKFRELGYTGSRVKIMSDEKIIKDKYKTEAWQKVICPKGYQTNKSKWHGSSVMHILQDICPDATFIAMPMDMKGKGEQYESKCIDYILENKVHLFTTSSTGGECSKAKEKAMQDCIDNGAIFFAVAGNKDDEGILGEPKSDKYISIGAVVEKDGKFKKASYSSIGEELDYVELEIYGIGTSFTAPTFCAMCGLVQDFFIAKTGRALVRSELIDFVNDHLLDVEDKGFDIKTGHGLFILPDPNTINIAKYVPEYSGSVDYSGFPEIKEEKKMPIVCLDSGHGISTSGKRSPDGTLLEYEFNRDVTSRIKTILERHDVEVVLTCYDNEDKTLEERCEIANRVKADYFVSIHANAYQETWNDVSGWEIYVISKGGKAENMAKKIQQYSKELGLKDRGIKVGNFQVLRDTDMPAILIEHGFYTNKEECEKLKSDSFRQRCAEVDAKGILEHLGIEYKEVKPVELMNKLVLTIGKKEYTINGQTKKLETAPKIENGRTLTTVAPLRDLGLIVEWNDKDRTITIYNKK